MPAETVVVAAGADTPSFCAPLGVHLPVEPSPALLLRFAAPTGLVRTLVSGGAVEARMAPDGHLLVAAEYNGEASLDGLSRTAEQTRRRLIATFRADAGDLRLVSVRVGIRPLPVGGLPIIGPLPGIHGVYLTVMHSGVTLAPVVGRLVAAEIVDHAKADELRDLRLERLMV